MKIRKPLLLVLFVSLTACAADPGEGLPVADVSDPAGTDGHGDEGHGDHDHADEGKADGSDTAPAVKRTVDLSQSKVAAVGAKVTRQHDLTFTVSAAEFMVGSDGAVQSLQVTVDMSSLVADVEKLTGHLKSPDFFNIAEHAKATFGSTAIKAGSDVEGATHTVTGDLIIVGSSNSITFPATIATDEDGTIRAHAEFVIDRQLWGISYPGKVDDLIKDNVALTIDVVAPPEG
jgi:polyisoprenoid-binding protein YceI